MKCGGKFSEPRELHGVLLYNLVPKLVGSLTDQNSLRYDTSEKSVPSLDECVQCNVFLFYPMPPAQLQ
uniref:Uncharacterized protein n=1 Tax=Romanomermis culicivorax TaxID=13658 RepID=A0A915IB77_ROMCU